MSAKGKKDTPGKKDGKKDAPAIDPVKAAEEAVAKITALENRIKAPSVWGRHVCGLRFEDLQEKRYEECIRFLKKHYINEELTWASMKLAEDKEATDEFVHNARIWLKDKMSIAVVKEGTEKLVGCLIMRIQAKDQYSRTFSRVKLTHHPIYTSVMTFYNTLQKPVDLYKELEVRSYVKVYVVALKNRYRHRGIVKELLKSAFGLAASGFIPAMAGIFTSSRLHQIAEEIGFKKYNEIYYIRYLVDDEMVFWDIPEGNYGCALYAYRIPDVEEIPELEAVPSSRFAPKAEEEKKEEDD